MKTKDLTIMAISLSLMVVCSKISFNIGIISLTLQTFAVVIISLLLGWKKAGIVFLTYIIMGLIGIPVFSTGGGFQYVLAPSFGFIVGFLVASLIIGSNFGKSKWMKVVKGIIGLLVLDIIGMIYMYIILKYYLESPKASVIYVIEAGFLPFILKDLVSTVLAALIAIRLEPVLLNDKDKNLVFDNLEKEELIKK